MGRYIKTFKDKGGDNNKYNKLMSLCIGGEKLLEKCKAIWTKIEGLEQLNCILYLSKVIDM